MKSIEGFKFVWIFEYLMIIFVTNEADISASAYISIKSSFVFTSNNRMISVLINVSILGDRVTQIIRLLEERFEVLRRSNGEISFCVHEMFHDKPRINGISCLRGCILMFHEICYHVIETSRSFKFLIVMHQSFHPV